MDSNEYEENQEIIEVSPPVGPILSNTEAKIHVIFKPKGEFKHR